jgi:hypothetical protein
MKPAMENIKDSKSWKEKIPLVHYSDLYSKLDPLEVSARCNIKFDDGCFFIRLMGSEYKIEFPSFNVCASDNMPDINEKILILRFLCEGRWAAFAGKSLSYREVPWGEVYFKNFEGRCIKRLARTYGDKTDLFCKIMDCNAELKAERISKSNISYRFEFMSNLYTSFFIWQGDDEFPASAQVLFDDNVPFAFSAEDLATVGEIIINRLKHFAEKVSK